MIIKFDRLLHLERGVYNSGCCGGLDHLIKVLLANIKKYEKNAPFGS